MWFSFNNLNNVVEYVPVRQRSQLIKYAKIAKFRPFVPGEGMLRFALTC